MKIISVWAKTNTTKAISLFVLIEITRLILGFWVGSQLHLSLSTFEVGLASILIAAVYFGTDTWRRTRVGEKLSYAGSRKMIAVGMTCSLLLAIVAGNSYGERNHRPIDDIRLSMCSQGGSSAIPVVLKYDETTKQQYTNVAPEKEFKSGWARTRCFLLFVLGLVLTYFGAALACGLACSEMAVLAVLLIIVVAGIYGGAFYFLLRGLRKNYVPWREMTKQERKREWLKYVIITISAVVLTVLFAALA